MITGAVNAITASISTAIKTITNTVRTRPKQLSLYKLLLKKLVPGLNNFLYIDSIAISQTFFFLSAQSRAKKMQKILYIDILISSWKLK